MSGPRPTPRSSRARVRGATIAAFVALAPLLPAAAVAVGTVKVDAALPYVCTLPSGPQQATVRITAAFPERAAVGEEIRPSDVTTTVELPAAAVAGLTTPQAAAVRAETRLTVGVAQDEQRAEAAWSGTAQPVPVPAEGPLVLATTGDVPSLTTGAAGELVLTAGALAVDLAPSAADGTATTPPSLSVACAPAPDAEGRTVLARVPVGAGASTGTPSAPPPPTTAPSSPSPSLPSDPPVPPTAPGVTRGTPGAPETPDAGPDPKPEGRGLGPAEEETPGTPGPRPDAPPCITEEPTPMSLSAYITGYSNVRKLNGANVIPVSCTLIEQGLPEIEFREDGIHLITKSVARLSYQGRAQTPPFRATFLTFGFTPTTATLVLEQKGPMTVDSDVLLVFPDNISETYVRAPLVLRVLDVQVNGTPLDVGPDCRTEKPLTSPEPDPATYPGDHLVLLGKGQLINGTDAEGYVLTGGGPLTGTVTIPPFKDCGAGGEDLDRLLTAAISGPDNYVKQIQGQTCSVGIEVPPPDQCTEDRQPLVVPKPER
ncbi:hypothetical protein HHL19_31565 [Streptomyces sp. R302]|uniref:DUF6801 domain-containing protein n=1 Tax=unclassified Streptomyces TaxID=2593676 RepID=UPI00145CB152|nr:MULTISPECIES: DUF6801 domain-containing protein [unclassified Streptomyces]NML53817.1 hypothetical protein [Streptomyces sp. R301]NML83076.1 hypothetical protein [Streptomyces sp. R302]